MHRYLLAVSRYALVDRDGNVWNVILWDGDTRVWRPPADLRAVPVPATEQNAEPGGTYLDGLFVRRPPESHLLSRYEQLRAKGWDNLTAAERDEAQRLMFERQL